MDPSSQQTPLKIVDVSRLSSAKDDQSSNEPPSPHSINAASSIPIAERNVLPVLDWDGPDDPENPQNWSSGVKVWHCLLPGIVGLLTTMSASMYTSGYEQVAQEFDVSGTAALLGLSLYCLGLAAGPAIAAPLSEIFGRWIVYVSTLFLTSIFTLGAGFSQNFASLLVTRLFAGVFAGPVLAIGGGTIRDLYQPRGMAIASTAFVLAPFLGPSIGKTYRPIIGGFVVEAEGWRWTQWVVLFAALPVLLSFITTRETYKKVILEKRAKKRGLDFRGPGSARQQLQSALAASLLRPIHMIFTESIVLALGIYSSFAFAVMFSFIAAFPLVFGEVYGFTDSQVGLSFIGLCVGVIAATISNVLVDALYFQKLVRKSVAEGRGGAVAPEHRLILAMFGGFGLPIGLFWFAWTARPSIHWISPILASAVFGWGVLCIFISTVMYMMVPYGAVNGASAIAANGILRYSLAAVFPLFTVQMYEVLGIGWATSLLGFVSVCLLPIPWVLFRYGPQICRKADMPTRYRSLSFRLH